VKHHRLPIFGQLQVYLDTIAPRDRRPNSRKAVFGAAILHVMQSAMRQGAGQKAGWQRSHLI
jgi:hypothetical protein